MWPPKLELRRSGSSGSSSLTMLTVTKCVGESVVYIGLRSSIGKDISPGTDGFIITLRHENLSRITGPLWGGITFSLLLNKTRCWTPCCPCDSSEMFILTKSRQSTFSMHYPHDNVIKWKHFPRYWPFANGWVNNRDAGDLKPIAIIMTSLQWLCGEIPVTSTYHPSYTRGPHLWRPWWGPESTGGNIVSADWWRSQTCSPRPSREERRYKCLRPGEARKSRGTPHHLGNDIKMGLFSILIKIYFNL